ncbi:50S ribosomal protein L11 methyltransferase [Aurantiacibacter aquimixticola]|uniref:Methyltransferase domain-containing protein n=1 Tax=Aurantiacibacter aquimixticola TaxID=1958945 RepID=A0A419RUI5_9SPHN|nr:50S ribosomal protein L11 methyltransferase [Aurantiacibacter aquimixticola]RJY09446.1 methyltransferase domain-containing protein [Aurantiacibacter aquimixticola]
MTSTLDEHIDYLQLEGRLDLYDEALAKVLREGDVVADLGCGVGVLGLAALKAGASHIYGIDQSDAIELTRETIARAGLSDRYTCMKASTFRCKLPEQVDLLLCDHVGYLGFDYGIIDMMRDAARRFLKPGGDAIPRKIQPVLAGACSAACRAKAREWGAQEIPAEYHWLENYGRNTKHNYEFDNGELCTAPAALQPIDLIAPGPDLFAMEADLEITSAGLFDGLAGWFDCELTPGVVMTNAPGRPESIARSNAFLPCQSSFHVNVGDRVHVGLKFRSDGEFLAWTITPPCGRPQVLSNWKSRILTAGDLRQAANAPITLNALGRARKAVFAATDGTRSAQAIADKVVSDNPDLFPTESALRRFVLREIGNVSE